MKILIAPNPSRDFGFKLTGAVAKILSDAGAEILLPEYVRSDGFNEVSGKISFYSGEICEYKPDAVISLGGDGTLLKAAREAALCDTPVIGINLGNIGFLTGLDPDEIGYI